MGIRVYGLFFHRCIVAYHFLERFLVSFYKNALTLICRPFAGVWLSAFFMKLIECIK